MNTVEYMNTVSIADSKKDHANIFNDKEHEEKDLKEHLKEKHEESYPKESAGSKKQKQGDTIRTENYANMNLFECDKCKYNFRRTNELEDHIQDYHCIEYTVS